MATGDDAAAAGFPLVASTDDIRDGYTEHNLTRDLVAGAVKLSDVAPAGLVAASKVVRFNAAGRIQVIDPAVPYDVANVRWVEARIAAIPAPVIPPAPPAFDGGTISGQLLIPAAYAAVSGYTIAYINSDGRVSRGASSRRFKKFISRVFPSSLGDLFAVGLSRFQMRQGDGAWRYGYIAEELADNPDTEPFVIYDQDGTPESFEMIGFLLAQVAQLNERLEALEASNVSAK